MEFVKKLIKNNSIDFILFEEDVVNSQKLINFLLDAFKYEISGDIAYLERTNGDVIKVRIE